jgi:hypothetical protein
VVARFDHRFRGHIDGVLKDGTLLEIKSTVQQDLDTIIANKTFKAHHLKQIEMYLEHGNYAKAIIVYVARDTGRMFALNVPRIESLIQALNEKAQRILAAFDAQQPPACECGRCNFPRVVKPEQQLTQTIIAAENGVYTLPG